MECVCVCTCLCAASAQVTVHSKGSLIIVGVIMEISVSLTIGADDKKKNYLFWCFCFLISCPLEISRDFYYHACVLPCLFSFSCFSIVQCVPATSYVCQSVVCVYMCVCVTEGCECVFPVTTQCPSK